MLYHFSNYYLSSQVIKFIPLIRRRVIYNYNNENAYHLYEYLTYEIEPSLALLKFHSTMLMCFYNYQTGFLAFSRLLVKKQLYSMFPDSV